MCRRLPLLLTGALLAATALSPRAASAQSEPVRAAPLGLLPGQLAERGPRFLLASGERQLPLDAARMPALTRRIALDLNGVSRRAAIRIIARQAGLELMFSDQVVPAGGEVRLRAEGITVAAALTDVLLDSEVDVVFTPSGSAALVKRIPPPLPPRSGTIVGRVTDARSTEPIAGAAVRLEGSTAGAVTDTEGRYRIDGAPPGNVTLSARRIGYAPARQAVVVVADSVVIADFTLEASATALDQVIVTGTPGGEQRRAIGNAVSSIDASDVLARSQAANLGSLLNARAPGVVVVSNGGRVGAGPDIQIRGRSSLSLGGSPLLYIDGVRVNNDVASGPSGTGGFGSARANVAARLNDISPEDIESIEIIKGPAAATLYGTEASNGVIQIITRKGARGDGAPRWTASVKQGTLWFMNPEGRIPTNYARDPETSVVIPWNAVEQENERGTPIFTNGRSQQYNLSLSGDKDSWRYYVAGAYRDDDGIEPNNSLTQFSGHANLDLAPSSRLDVATSLNYVDGTAHLGADGSVSAMLDAKVGHPVLYPDSRGFFVVPPEVPQRLYDNSQAISRFTGSTTFDHRYASWFSQRLILGIDRANADSRALERYAPPDLAAFLTATQAAGRIGQTVASTTVITADYSGTVRAQLAPSVSSATSLGGQFYRTRQSTSFLGGSGFPAPNVETVSATALQNPARQDELLNTTIGAYAQQRFGWRDRLFLTGAIRVDNNSAFGEDFKWVTYPKVSASWVASEEPFWKVGFINTLRLRAAYGESGRQPAAFAALRTLVPVRGPGNTNAVTPGSVGNSDLRPERGKEVELGFEAQLFDRLTLDFTYFDKRTTDAILQQPTAPSVGFTGTRYVNLGKVSNHGIELQADFRALQRERVTWEIGGNVGTSSDRIDDMGDLPSVIVRHQNNVVGYPIGGFWVRRVVRADRDPATGFATNVLCDGGAGQAPLPCADAPFVYWGTPTPKVTGALSNTVTLFQRLRLYALVDFKRGNKMFNSDEEVRCDGALGVGLCEANYHPERYSPIYLAQLSTTGASLGIEDAFIQNASFVKLREVSATYTLPERWLRRAGVSRAAITLAARELHTWTDYRGPDPEVRFNPTSTSVLNEDQGLVPPLSQFVASIHLTF